MPTHGPEQIRNVVLVGHSHEGKTSLAEAMLFASGAIARMGSTDTGTSALDTDPEEHRHRISISLGVAHLEHAGHKVNLLDSPGFLDFAGRRAEALGVAESAIVVVSPSDRVAVGTEVAWEQLNRQSKPRLVVVNKLDKERSDFYAAIEALRATLKPRPVPVQVPIGAEGSFRGIVDLLHRRAHVSASNGGSGEEPVPADLAGRVDEFRDQLMEAAAEADDSLLEKYLDTGALDDEEIRRGLAAGIRAGTLAPVVCCAATRLVGVPSLLDAVVELLPSAEGDPAGQDRAFVFNSTADQYGKISYFKTLSGRIGSDRTVPNVTRGTDERLGHLFFPRGREHVSCTEVVAGDIGAATKLQHTFTGDTLGSRDGGPLTPIEMPGPVYSLAIFPKARGDEEKISTGLARLAEEDPALHVERSEVTHQLLISGLGDVHLDVVLEKLRRKFGVEAVTQIPKLAYKETVAGRARAEGRHVKQSGGHGQYAICTIEVRPTAPGKGFVWEDKIFGGAIPQNFRPSVEKGVREAMEKGIVAGYEMVDVAVSLVDGKYHSVDSSDMAFQIAGALAIRKAAHDAGPVLLEPIVKVDVRVPARFLGDVMSDLNTRRGRIAGTDPANGWQTVTAQVPEAEMLRFALDLRSLTQGRGSFATTFSHYEVVPANLARSLIEEHQKEHATS